MSHCPTLLRQPWRKRAHYHPSPLGRLQRAVGGRSLPTLTEQQKEVILQERQLYNSNPPGDPGSTTSETSATSGSSSGAATSTDAAGVSQARRQPLTGPGGTVAAPGTTDQGGLHAWLAASREAEEAAAAAARVGGPALPLPGATAAQPGGSRAAMAAPLLQGKAAVAPQAVLLGRDAPSFLANGAVETLVGVQGSRARLPPDAPLPVDPDGHSAVTVLVNDGSAQGSLGSSAGSGRGGAAAGAEQPGAGQARALRGRRLAEVGSRRQLKPSLVKGDLVAAPKRDMLVW